MMYASGEPPLPGDRVTLIRHKPHAPGTVLEITPDGGSVRVLWSGSRYPTTYAAGRLVLVSCPEGAQPGTQEETT